MNRLLLYTKSSHDYNILLTEIRAANIAYHTYPLPGAIQPRLVLKGIPPNVPEEDVQGELAAYDIKTVKVTQLTKTDTLTGTIINNYPIFVITFQPGTEIRKVLQLRKLCLSLIRWEKFHIHGPLDNVLTVRLLVTPQIFVVAPQSV